MDSVNEKSKPCIDYMEKKRDEFLNILTHVGAKLYALNEGNVDWEDFLGCMLPTPDDLMSRIIQQVSQSDLNDSSCSKQDNKELSKDPADCLDSSLVDALKREHKKLEKEILKLSEASCRKAASKLKCAKGNAISAKKLPRQKPDKKESQGCTDGNTEIKEAKGETASVDGSGRSCRCVNKREQVGLKSIPEHPDGYHCLSQVINPGEMSKIFVQKTRCDVVSSAVDAPSFDDDNVETIYIYRSKKSAE